MMSTLAIGWAAASGFGALGGSGIRIASPDGATPLSAAAAPFTHTVKNFARFTLEAKLTCAAAAAALTAAGMNPPEGERVNLGIVGTGWGGCLAANAAYFRDYVENGRTLGRGNLFIYTLPTSALAEACIHLGLSGPALHVSATANPLAASVDATLDLLAGGQADGMLAVWHDGSVSLAALLAEGRTGPGLDAFAPAWLRDWNGSLPEMIACLTKRSQAPGTAREAARPPERPGLRVECETPASRDSARCSADNPCEAFPDGKGGR